MRKHVQFGKGVNYIGEEAFYNCQGLESVVIPESVATLGSKAFGKCTGLSEVIIEEGSSPLEALLSENEKSAEPFSGCIINHLYLNRMIKNIGLKYAGIKHLKVGDIYTSIPDEMFLKVKSLKSVNFEGQSLVRIGKDAFSGCLGKITFPQSTAGKPANTQKKATMADLLDEDEADDLDEEDLEDYLKEEAE